MTRNRFTKITLPLRPGFFDRYGEEWYEQLEYAAREIETGNIEIPPR